MNRKLLTGWCMIVAGIAMIGIGAYLHHPKKPAPTGKIELRDNKEFTPRSGSTVVTLPKTRIEGNGQAAVSLRDFWQKTAWDSAVKAVHECQGKSLTFGGKIKECVEQKWTEFKGGGK